MKILKRLKIASGFAVVLTYCVLVFPVFMAISIIMLAASKETLFKYKKVFFSHDWIDIYYFNHRGCVKWLASLIEAFGNIPSAYLYLKEPTKSLNNLLQLRAFESYNSSIKKPEKEALYLIFILISVFTVLFFSFIYI